MCASLVFQVFFKDGETGADLVLTQEERENSKLLQAKFEKGRYLVRRSRFEEKVARGHAAFTPRNHALNELVYPMVKMQVC